MEKITVYSKEHCQPCRATERMMGKLALDYDVVSLDENPDKVQVFKAMGMMESPIVEAGEEMWSGFRPDRIKALGQRALGDVV